MEKLLTRDEFRDQVFLRDSHLCVICGAAAVDAHHIMERRLWPDGGYYLSNGASVCEEHHLECERTIISVESIREACGIVKYTIPPHLYRDHVYDKWGNPILHNGLRLKGELFHDESVQKILAEGGVLDLFTNWVKYPRTHHLPWSPGLTEDDRVLTSMKAFEGKRVIVTEKMDGENTTMYSDYIHARSVDGRHHHTRDWVKQHWSRLSMDIPEGWRVCGENMFAKHSIHYTNLQSYFLIFSIWNDKNVCLSWDETVEWATLMGVPTVRVLYDGIYDEQLIKGLWNDKEWETTEGYVLRVADSFTYQQFRQCVGKFVRKNHVQTIKHWMHGQRLEKNLLKP